MPCLWGTMPRLTGNYATPSVCQAILAKATVQGLPLMDFTCLTIQLIVLVTIALHLIAGLLPEEMAWSVWPYTALPALLAWLGGLMVVSLTLAPVNDVVGRGFRRLAGGLRVRKNITSRWSAGFSLLSSGKQAKACTPMTEFILLRVLRSCLTGVGTKRLWFAVIALGMAIPFWLFRIRHVRWGDAHFIVKALSYVGPDRPVWTVYNWQSPLSIFIHAQLWFLLNPILGVGVDTLYAVSSVLAGVGFVFVLFLLADALGRDWAEKATIFGLVFTTGSMQLFFGYVENYTVISFGLILTLHLGIRCLRGEISLVWPSLALAFTNAFHPSTIVLWPAVGYVAWQVVRRQPPLAPLERRNPHSGAEWAKLVLPPLLVLAGLTLLMTAGGHGPGALLLDDRPGGADGIPFVPLFRVTTEWQHYTMFSLAHLLDWANEHFLISPFGLPLLLIALVNGLIIRKKTKRSVQHDERSASNLRAKQGTSGAVTFLTIASLAYLLLTFVWNPDYGGRRDWDLFAPSAFVYTLLAAFLLARQLRGRPDPQESRCTLARVARLLIAASALHTLAWIYYNTIPWPYG
jgi:hypothetical protein